MKKRFWKVEYSITIFVVFAICLMFVPTRFIASKEVTYISMWNETINKMEYVFNAMNAHAETNIIKSLKKAKDDTAREQIMMTLVKPYLTKNNKIIGIKDIKDEDVYHPVFLMMFDMNGLKGPNMWGKDVFGLNIFIDGNITPLGSGWDIDDLKADCSTSGTGVACSHYYRIGGNFNE